MNGPESLRSANRHAVTGVRPRNEACASIPFHASAWNSRADRVLPQSAGGDGLAQDLLEDCLARHCSYGGTIRRRVTDRPEGRALANDSRPPGTSPARCDGILIDMEPWDALDAATELHIAQRRVTPRLDLLGGR